mgnify:CR=1 FL=1
MMHYRDYIAEVIYDDSIASFVGRVLNTRDVLTFQGTSVAQLERALKDTIEDYLEWCAKRGEAPDKPYSGQFRLRISPALHRKLAATADAKRKSLNAFVAETLEEALEVAER